MPSLGMVSQPGSAAEVLAAQGVDASRAISAAMPPRSALMRPLVLLFSSATFMGAALVFMVQPMIARLILPNLGGSPAVWNTSMVFFQALLLAGYAYVHFSVRALGHRRQPVLHLGLLMLPLLVLPIALPAWSPPNRNVAVWLLVLLGAAVGAPFFAVATAGPLLQRWFSSTDDPAAADPYFLYATGNVGSTLGLLAYPVLMEPFLPLALQTRVWTAGYVLFVILAAACAVKAMRSLPAGGPSGGNIIAATRIPALSAGVRVRWIGLAFLPSSLMLGATTYLSTDVAAVPLLWIVPLGLYLSTFILAFSRRGSGVSVVARKWLPLVVVPALLAATPHFWHLPGVAFVLHFAALFVVAAAAHGRLASERPPVEGLTEFYLLIAFGGVLGGVFNALVAPSFFNTLLEYPLVLLVALLWFTAGLSGVRRRVLGLSLGVLPAACLFLAPLAVTGLLVATGTRATWVPWLLLLLAAAAAIGYRIAEKPARYLLTAALVAAMVLLGGRPGLHADRTFFGMHRVIDDDGYHLLMHGTTVHGAETAAPEIAGQPLTYYHPQGPAGDIFQSRPGTGRLAVVGLGTGALAWYPHSGQSMDFFEIDPAVVRIAQDARLFTYLERSQGDVEIALGDGRLMLARQPNDSYDVLILDAFSSDAIPVHLMTREAVEVYLTKVVPDGVVVFHISNRYLDLEPVLAGIADELGLTGVARVDPGKPGHERTASHWLVLARDRDALGPLSADDNWRRLRAGPPGRTWTDDFSNILHALRWW